MHDAALLSRERPLTGPMALAPTVPMLRAETSADLQTRAKEAASLLKALANPDRLLLLCQLAAGERTVSELGQLSGIAQPSLSQQLGVLRNERLVATRRDGKSVVYRVNSPAAIAILQTLCGLFCAPPAVAPPASQAAMTGESHRKQTAS